MKMRASVILAAVGFVAIGGLSGSAVAQPANEIVLGQTLPYSGTASSWSVVGRAHRAFFERLNAEGGINGKMVKVVSLDDGYTPSKTVEQTRRLAEREGVIAMFGSLNAGAQIAVRPYLQSKGIPQLFMNIGEDIWTAEDKYKGTLFAPLRKTETDAYVAYILATRPTAKIGVLYQNDEFGRQMIRALRASLGDKANLIVKEISYESTDATIDSQIIDLRAAGVDTFVNFANPKFASQAIKKAGELGWKPEQLLFSFSAIVDSVFKPAGLEYAKDIVTATYLKDPTDPALKDDQGVKDYLEFMKKHYADGEPANIINIIGYTGAQMITQALKQAGNDLSGQNLAVQARQIKEMQLPMMLPGIMFYTKPEGPASIHTMKLQRFDGSRWVLIK